MIYIDLDGVCADFNKAVLKYTGKPYNGKETWSILENIPRLFYNLDVMQDAKESVSKLIDTYGYRNVEISTALPLQTKELVSAQVDKVQWVHTKIDPMIQVNCVPNWRFKKYFVQSSNDILIDDMARNVEEWEESGGIGILHTSWSNTLNILGIEQ